MSVSLSDTLMLKIRVSTTKKTREWAFGNQGERWGRQAVLSGAHSWGWRDGPVVKRTSWSSRGPGLDF